MLTGRDQHTGRDITAKISVSPIVIGWESFFDPFEIKLFRALCKLGGVIKVETHPAIKHQPKVITNFFTH
ncbi:hypothetical protein D3C84_1075740 [compost metagenome]